MKRKHHGGGKRGKQSQGKQSQGRSGKGRRHGRFEHRRESNDGGSFLANRPQKRHQGKVEKNRKGFAFVISLDKQTPDAYVDVQQAQCLLHGDIVEYTVKRSGQRVYGNIAAVVGHSQTQVFGKVVESKGRFFIDTERDFFVIKDKSKNLKNDEWVLAKIVDYPTRDHPARVVVHDSLGNDLSPKHDILITVSKYSLPNEFPPEVLKEADEAIERAKLELANPAPTRVDMRHMPFVTIDGEDAKDFDDAVLVEIPQKGPAFILYVAIADVSFFVRDGTALDTEALNRATSVYFPGIAIPMLPHQLSDNVCSLRPREDKLAMVAEIHFDRHGVMLDAKFYDAIICTTRRLTYTLVHDFIERRNLEDFKDVEKPLHNAYQLYKKLMEVRKKRGVLDFDLPEAKLQVDKDGMPVSVYRAPRYESHKLIEEFMIAANQVVAKALRDGRHKALYRIHETPEPDALVEINQLTKSLGFSYMMKELTPSAFAALLEHTMGKKGAKTLHTMVLRAQRQARYSPYPVGHFGLALRDYAHFTSPIRRYPDLLVHRALKRLIGTHEKADKFNKDHNFDELGELTSERERRATEAERFIVRRKQCWFMQDRVGEKYEGVISGVIGKGLFVEIPEYSLEGFLPKDSLDGHYEFDEPRMCMRKRPGHETLGLGDTIKIIVERVSVDDNEITFNIDQ